MIEIKEVRKIKKKRHPISRIKEWSEDHLAVPLWVLLVIYGIIFGIAFMPLFFSGLYSIQTSIALSAIVLVVFAIFTASTFYQS